MFRILRKYSAWILGIGGTLLLIAFLAPQALQEFAVRAGQQGAIEATVGPENTKIRSSEWSEAVMQVGILDRLQNLSEQPLRFPLIGTVTDAAHWFLLAREAEALGLVGSPYANNQGSDLVTQFAAATGVSPSAVYQTLARVDGIQRMLSLYLDSTKISDHRLTAVANKMLTEAEVSVAVIKKDMPDSFQDYSDDAMEKQLNSWSDSVPNADSPFGYQLPNRIQLNWFKIEGANIRSMVASDSSKTGSRAQRKFWRLNESNPEYPALEPGTAVPPIVKEDLINTEQVKATEEIKRFISDKLRAPRRGIETKNGFFELPEDWPSKRVPLDAIQKEIEQTYKIKSEKININEKLVALNEIPDELAKGKTDQFGRKIGITELLRASKEFGGNGLYPIQEGLALPTLQGPDGSLYIARITKTDAKRAPLDIEEAREKIINDLNLIAGYEELKEQIKDIEEFAENSGMIALADRYATSIESIPSVTRFRNLLAGFGGAQQASQLAQGYALTFAQLASNNSPSEKLGSPLGSLGNSPEVVDKILDWATNLKLNSDQYSTIKAWPVKDKYALIVVKIHEVKGPSIDLYRALLSGSTALLPRLISYNETEEFQSASKAFSLETLIKRNNFIRSSKEDNIEE